MAISWPARRQANLVALAPPQRSRACTASKSLGLQLARYFNQSHSHSHFPAVSQDTACKVHQCVRHFVSSTVSFPGLQAFLPVILQGLSTLTVRSDRRPVSLTALEALSRSAPDSLISGGARSDGGPHEMLPLGGSDDEALPAWAESPTHTAVSAHNSRKVIYKRIESLKSTDKV